MKRVLKMDRKNKWYAVAGASFLAAALVLQVAARNSGGFATWYAHHVYPVLVGIVGRFFGIFPFSVVEILLYLLVLLSVVYAMRFFREPLRLVSRTVFLVGFLLFSYTANCGVNYYAAAFSSYAGLETGLYSKAELEELCRFLVEQVN